MLGMPFDGFVAGAACGAGLATTGAASWVTVMLSGDRADETRDCTAATVSVDTNAAARTVPMTHASGGRGRPATSDMAEAIATVGSVRLGAAAGPTGTAASLMTGEWK